MRDIRLGDDIDDFCVRCKRVMNHAVVSVLNGAAAKVRCRTCHSDHDFRNEQPPPPKIDPRKAALFNEVLKKVDPTAEAAGDPEELALPELAVPELAAPELAVPELAVPEEAALAATAEAAVEAPVAAAPEAKPKKGRAKK
jgi:hypothetical protein